MKCFRRLRAWRMMRKMDRWHWERDFCSVRKPGIPAVRFYRNALIFKKHKLGPWKE